MRHLQYGCGFSVIRHPLHIHLSLEVRCSSSKRWVTGIFATGIFALWLKQQIDMYMQTHKYIYIRIQLQSMRIWTYTQLYTINHLWIQSPSEKGFMEPTYYAFRRWLDTPCSSSENMTGCLGLYLLTMKNNSFGQLKIRWFTIKKIL